MKLVIAEKPSVRAEDTYASGFVRSFSKCGIGTLSLVHPFQAIKSGPDPGNVSSALRSRRKGQRYVFQPGGIRKEDQRTQKDRRSDTGSVVGRIEHQYRPDEKNGVRLKRSVSGSADFSCSLFRCQHGLSADGSRLCESALQEET